MNPILESLLVVASAICAAVVLCSLIGAVRYAVQPDHEADAHVVPPLGGIPTDRDFTDPETNPVHRVNPVLPNPVPLTAPPMIIIVGKMTPTATNPDRL